MSEQSSMNVEQTSNTIKISKTYDAPPELVFLMFKDPAHLAKWWGPTTWPATIASYEFKPGGVWHYYMTGPDGTQAWGKATFQEIDEPNRLSFTDAFSDKDGNVNPELPQGKVTFTFEETDGKTLLSMVGEYQSEEEAKKLVEMGMIEGMKDTWSQLEALLDSQK